MLASDRSPMNGRAEHKVAGGKLLRADVAVTDTIDAVTLHGDFFCYPETELETIEAALEGADSSADRDELADRVTAALDPGTVLLGFGPDDVAQVVTEAAGDADA